LLAKLPLANELKPCLENKKLTRTFKIRMINGEDWQGHENCLHIHTTKSPEKSNIKVCRFIRKAERVVDSKNWKEVSE
jgi:hypothetical protein